MKMCKCCNNLLPENCFIKDKTRTDGLYVYCKECNFLRRKVFREANKESISLSKKEYYNLNKEKINSKKKESYLIKLSDSTYIIEKCKRNSEWKKRNKGIVNKWTASRRAAKLKASCDWGELNSFIIEEAYLLTSLRSSTTNTKWEVDHIVPLINPLVCGLHVGINLQVIPEVENRTKSNTFII
jgi:hypothetical protein